MVGTALNRLDPWGVSPVLCSVVVGDKKLSVAARDAADVSGTGLDVADRLLRSSLNLHRGHNTAQQRDDQPTVSSCRGSCPKIAGWVWVVFPVCPLSPHIQQSPSHPAPLPPRYAHLADRLCLSCCTPLSSSSVASRGLCARMACCKLLKCDLNRSHTTAPPPAAESMQGLWNDIEPLPVADHKQLAAADMRRSMQGATGTCSGPHLVQLVTAVSSLASQLAAQ